MANVAEQPKVLAPYVSYKTLRTFLDSLRQGVPSRIDRSLMSNWSGAVQNQIVAALKFLSLIDEQNVPTLLLRQFVQSEGEEKRDLLTHILHSAYPNLFASDDFLTTATVSQFHEAFQATGAKGDTIRKNETFFLAAVADAGIPVHARLSKAAAAARTGKVSTPRIATILPAKKISPPSPAPEPSPKRPVSGHQRSSTTKTIELISGGTITLTVAVDLFELDEDETQFVLELRRKFRDYEQSMATKTLATAHVGDVVEDSDG